MENRFFTVNGMRCEHCKASVENAIKEIAGVETAEVDLANKNSKGFVRQQFGKSRQNKSGSRCNRSLRTNFIRIIRRKKNEKDHSSNRYGMFGMFCQYREETK